MQSFSMRNAVFPYLCVAYRHGVKKLLHYYENYRHRQNCHKRKPPVHNKKQYAYYHKGKYFYYGVLAVCSDEVLKLCGVA